jgi:ATP-binding cassette subfamily C protein
MNIRQLLETATIAGEAMWSYPRRTLVIAALFILASLAEGFGVASVIPLLSLIGDGTSNETPVAQGVSNLLASVGLEPKLGILLSVIAIGISLKAGLMFLAMGQLGFATAAIAADLRSAMLDALLKARWSYFIHEPIGVLANTFGIEANSAAGMVGYIARTFALLVQILMYLTLAIFVSWQVTVAAIAAGAFIFVLLDKLVEMARKAGAASLASLRALLSHLADSLQGI